MGKQLSFGMTTRSASKATVTALKSCKTSDNASAPDAPKCNDTGNTKPKSLCIKSHEAACGARPKRKRISPEQFQALAELFERTDTPNYELRDQIAKKLNMTNREVQVWFQNRRAKFMRLRQQEQRRQELEEQQRYSHQNDAINNSVPYRQWPDVSYYQQPSSCGGSLSSDLSSLASTPTWSICPVPTLSPDMAPLDVLALAADYMRRHDEIQKNHSKQTTPNTSSCFPLVPTSITSITINTANIPFAVTPSTKRWRPWL